jgi:protein-disulfide isomerase
MASGKASKRKRAAERPPASSTPGPDRRVWVAVAVVAALAVAVVAGVLLTRGDEGGANVSTTGSTLPSADEALDLFQGIPQAGVALGRPDSPVTLVEFVDMQCPFCRQFEVDVMPTLVREHVRDRTLRIETRGLAFIGPDSERGMRAVLAAGEQERLYEMKALLFANQGPENAGWLSDDLIAAAGRSIPGLDVQQLFDDMESDEVDELLAEHAADAERRGVNSTPTVLVGPAGGELELVELEDPSDVATVEAAIEAARG